MKYSFNNFQFDSEQQILTRDGKVITLNEKPAKLLTLLLLEPHKVHNKNVILEYVWPDRVISEQVVFQNISYLRALFGNASIKTFVKKGYQWQFQLKKIEEASDDIDIAEDVGVKNQAGWMSQTSKNVNYFLFLSNKNIFLASMLAVSLLVYVGFLSFSENVNKKKEELIVLGFESSSSQQPQIVKGALNDASLFNLDLLETVLTTQIFFDSPYTSWKKIAKTSSTLLLATRLYDIQNALVLRFHIQGEYRGWQGHIYASDQEELYKRLDDLLTLLAGSEYFSVKSAHSALAKLTLLHESAANDLLTYQLINMNYELGYLDRAIAFIDTQIELEPNKLELGLLHLLKAKIILKNTDWQSSQRHIVKAIELFDELNLPHLEYLTRIEQAWYEVHNSDYSRVRSSLNLAIARARAANEPLQEMLAHLTQASLAGKDLQFTLMNTELDLANQLFIIHKLGDEHRVPILHALAAASDNDEVKLNHYEQILKQPFSALYSRRFYYTAEAVRDNYIDKQQWGKAIETIKPWQRRSFRKLSMAYIAFAQQATKQGIQAATQAFRSAQIDYFLQDALNAALLLLQQTEQELELEALLEYINYIKQNASHRWLRDNKPALGELNAFKNDAAF